MPVGGKSSIPFVHAILTAIGIPVYTLFDGDSGFEALAKAQGKSAENIEKERASHIKANRTTLRYFGHTEEDFPKVVVSDCVAIFDDHLESFLLSTWPEWDIACNWRQRQE
ncbi:hypothetical protein NHH73_16470 [Oxalobacteraceae bacterium OTU3CINTB1]|nr:hypothetical protein NHH73_16470 [Oxalobacteraceae bacterium OTU3CINTB1]